MTQLITWLLAAAWPVARKVLVMLGIGWVSYEGVTTLTNNIISVAQANWGQVSGAVLQICSIGGIPQMMGIICGAIVARASLAAVSKLTKMAS